MHLNPNLTLYTKINWRYLEKGKISVIFFTYVAEKSHSKYESTKTIVKEKYLDFTVSDINNKKAIKW